MTIAIAPLTTHPVLANVLNPAGNDPASRASDRAAETLAQAGASKDKTQEAIVKESDASEQVTLSATSDAPEVARTVAAPFAEIWKDGRKLAEVDARGEVRGYGGVLAGLPSGGSGLAVAATRAAVLAQSLGAEIRSAGMITDARTLTMRSRLQTAYTPAG